jgi:hypothetical protein
MYTPAQHGAAIASPSIADAVSSSNGDGWLTLVQAMLSLSIVLALAILWWRTLRLPQVSEGDDERS